MNVKPVLPWKTQALPCGFSALYPTLLVTALVLGSPRFSVGAKMVFVFLVIAVPALGAVLSIINTIWKRRHRTVPEC